MRGSGGHKQSERRAPAPTIRAPAGKSKMWKEKEKHGLILMEVEQPQRYHLKEELVQAVAIHTGA